jgi:nitrous oxidase accessory protein NosD
LKYKASVLWSLAIIILLSLNSQAQPRTSKSPFIHPISYRATLYVDDDNIEGPWDGSLEHPYQNIQDAIEEAGQGDNIFVFSGVYQENIIIEKSLDLNGENTSQTIIDGMNSSTIIDIKSDNVVIQNFTIKNSNGNQGSSGITIKAKNTKIQTCYIYRTKTAVLIENASDFIIDQCRIYINGEGILTINSTNGTIKQSYITQNGFGININNSTNILTTYSYIHTNGIGAFIKKSNKLYFNKCAISENCDNQGAIFIYASSKINITDSNFIQNGVGLKIETSKDISIHQTSLQRNTHFTIMARKNCSNLSISSCDISNNYRYGLHLKDSIVIVRNSNFYHNRLYGIHLTNTTCYAQQNWWNRSFGPSLTALTKADRISFDLTNVKIFPWKTKKNPLAGSTWITEEIFEKHPLPHDADREINLPGNDSDNDQVPDWWEEKWGYNPQAWDDHKNLDPDMDALNNIEECYTDIYGSNPFHQDIFLEFDWTISKNQENTNKPSAEKITEMIQRFIDHNITLHIDTGQLEGGEEIPYFPAYNYDILLNLYWDYFLHNNINNPRKGIFHYGIISDIGPGPGFSFIGWYHHDSFCISAQTLADGNPQWTREQLIIKGSMHELGHTLGLFADDHNGNDNRGAVKPWYKDYWLFRNYKSCMNYRYTWQILDYSDGTHGTGDYNDWGMLDLQFFKNTSYG